MKSITLALTWEYWRQTGVELLKTIAVLTVTMMLLYGGLRLDRPYMRDPSMYTSFQIVCFLIVVVILSAATCSPTGPSRYRLTLPVPTQTFILVPMINGAIATAVGYLSIALILNWSFNAEWNLAKPTVTAIAMITLCQACSWLLWVSSTLRGAITAGISTVLGIAVLYLHGIQTQEQLSREWQRLRPLDVACAIIAPVAAFLFSYIALTLARRGQVLSMTEFGRWLFAKLDVRFNSSTHQATPIAAELWAEWALRGRVMPVGAVLISIVLCGFYLTGRFEWESAIQGLAVATWLQLISAPLLGLFLGQVGERFDFHEYLATRPLSDQQIADVKLWSTFQSCYCTWGVWLAGAAAVVLCMAIVGQGPRQWSDMLPPDTIPQMTIATLVMVPLISWTLTSLGVSVAILRPWLVKTLFGSVAILPFFPLVLHLLLPDSAADGILSWGWIAGTIGGTAALYVAAFRLGLITATRIAMIGIAYVLLAGAGAILASVLLPPTDEPAGRHLGLLFSTCALPFVTFAAVPLAVWWNRHR
ncbi:MAG: hypothetical protein H6822_30945 [Planctomycetaceae bacterium]|nr:hypothetical protein [Planctomycetales bacterium]MCB9926599.1 hypothetical protein [Planctomycetaceae bacterium]